MSSYEKILVPVDFSTHSAQATRVAADLARRFDAALTLAYVYDPLAYALPDGFAMVGQTEVDRLLDAFRAQLAQNKRQALEAGAPRVDTQLLQGFVSGEIVEFANRGQFDLIVMGTHGRTGMQHLVMGSVAERVVRLAQCPVLTVKPTAERKAA
ncbi:MAG TPA: universal stress protein [Polyangiaceae bacterium]|nr:universal stress protein [Polyangiaceae bacterium]